MLPKRAVFYMLFRRRRNCLCVESLRAYLCDLIPHLFTNFGNPVMCTTLKKPLCRDKLY